MLSQLKLWVLAWSQSAYCPHLGADLSVGDVQGDSVFNERWFGFIAPFGLPRPGQCTTYMIIAARKADDDDVANEAFLNFAMDLEKKVVSEDVPILQTIHFKPGTLTRSDKALSKFLQYLRNFPRAHPSAEFIV